MDHDYLVLQEYVLLRTEAVVAVPSDLDPAEAAPLLCAGVTVYNSMRNMDNVHAGDLVAVQGIGGLGHLAIQVRFLLASLSPGCRRTLTCFVPPLSNSTPRRWASA
jgi:Zn-dependent alcohol dehydrogenase